MGRRILGRFVIATFAGLSIFGGASRLPLGQEVKAPTRLQLIVPNSNTPTRRIAVGLSTLAKLSIGEFNIDKVWTGQQQNPLSLIRENGNRFALVDFDQIDMSKLKADPDLRVVMRFWHIAGSKGQIIDGDDHGSLLVTGASMSPFFVRMLVNTILSDKIVLKASNVDMDKLNPSIAMRNLPLAAHQGTTDYLENPEVGLSAVSETKIETADLT